MNLMIFVVSPMVGSVIGYFTNWVAIKMLFRPLTEKRIFGLKLPFTPGVIPRRRGKLAESIGDMVGRQLLTADAFHNILQSENMRSKLKEFIQERIRSLKQEERSLAEIMEKVIADRQQRETLAKKIKKVFFKGIKSLLKEDKIVELLDKQVDKLEVEDLAAYFNSSDYQQLRSELAEAIAASLDGEASQEELAKLIQEQVNKLENSEQTLAELLPQGLQVAIKDWLAEQGPQLVEELINFLGSPQTRERINQKLEEFLENNSLMQMISGFIDKDKIIDQLMEKMVKFLREPANQEEIVEQVNQFLDSILETEVATIAAKLDEEAVAEISEFLIANLASVEVSEQLLSLLEGVALEKIAQLQELTTQQRQAYKDKLEAVLNKLLSKESLWEALELWSSEQLDQLGSKPVTTYFKKLDLETIEQLETGILAALTYTVKNHLGKVLSTLNFKEMVKRKVNSFDILEVEALILNVIETELKAITWFGAALGMIMGLITPLINLLMQ
ncbi:DUF445 family protein [Fuchsiella alkaliacetigena]|uniref:DUF445 family protein n=1 Tax=Fuchsiella alkaliacetigena TaxID=957042 RepID=UPI00200B0640|nr:DUF445 family protein [Fuchsiella alkaliacetigena]MCK8823730.1 DUF2497 domain-containing protein [Fuchsiella alkaliacetigena]